MRRRRTTVQSAKYHPSLYSKKRLGAGVEIPDMVRGTISFSVFMKGIVFQTERWLVAHTRHRQLYAFLLTFPAMAPGNVLPFKESYRGGGGGGGGGEDLFPCHALRATLRYQESA